MEMIEENVGGVIVRRGPDVVDNNVARNMSVGSFYDRFGSAKWAILSSAEPMIQAFIADTKVRKYISLDTPDTIEGVKYIGTGNFGIDVDKILNDPIQPWELP